MKKFFLCVAIFIIASFLLNEVMAVQMRWENASKSLGMLNASGEGVGCHWAKSTCGDKSEREVCVVDGDGYDCTCGTVTRSCGGSAGGDGGAN